MTQKTALYDQHIQLNARMIPFHGWFMPLHYGSQLQEHHAVRTSTGVFDVSHMTIIDILGPPARQLLRTMLTKDIDQLKHVGKGMYCCMCNTHGGIIDDVIVYQRKPDNYRIISNSATKHRVMSWIQEMNNGFSASIQHRTDLSMIALQGPHTFNILSSILSPAEQDALSTLAPFESFERGDRFFARTGYTGELGVELILPDEEINTFWSLLLNAGVQPCGLGARDTLRLEAGLLLYGQDMDETTSPLESNLSWTIHWTPSERNFIGKSALEAQKEQGIQRTLVGIALKDPVIMRPGQTLYDEHRPIGKITSGSFSPTLNHTIGFARIQKDHLNPIYIDIRNKKYIVDLVHPRFLTSHTKGS